MKGRTTPLFRHGKIRATLQIRATLHRTPGAKRSTIFGIRTIAFSVLAGLLTLALYPDRGSAAFRRAEAGDVKAEARASTAPAAAASASVTSAASYAGAAMLQTAGQGISTYDCTTGLPKTEFALGDEVCAKATGVPTTLFPWRVSWVDTAGFIEQSGSADTDTSTEYRFPLPGAATSVVNSRTVKNYGTWRVNLTRASGAIQATAFFVVNNTTPIADLSAYKFVRGTNLSVAGGGNLAFGIIITNRGPSAASDVTVTDAMPPNSSLVSFTQNTGPECLPANTSPCTMASMARAEKAEFTAVYTVGGSPGTVFTSASVASPTEDTDSLDRTGFAVFEITSASGVSNCVLTCPSNITATANATQGGQPGAFVSYSAASVSGDCGAVSNSPASGAFFTVGTHTITSTSATGGGSCTFTVKVLNTSPPTITCPANRTATADANSDEATVAVGTPTFTASGGGTVTSLRSDSTPAVLDAEGDVITPAIPKALTDPYPVGITGIVWTVTDADGRTASCRQIVIVNGTSCGDDDENPVITVAPPNITIGTGAGNTGATLALDDELGQLEATDNCSVTITVSGIPPGNAFPIGTTTVTHTATDGAGNSVSHNQTVTVVDDTPPFIAAPANASYTCPSEVPAAHPSQATRGEVFDEDGNLLPPGPPFDNSGTVTVTVSETSSGAGSAASPLVITRVYTATDGASPANSASATQTITVIDAAPPTISAPADATYECAALVPGANAAQATASDNCTVSVAVVQTDNGGAGSSASPLVITRTFTATDGAGNTASAAQTITVIDTTPPVVTPPPNVAVYLPLNSTATSMVVNYPNPATATDNCGGPVNITYSPASGSTFPVGTTPVTVTATDNHGKSGTATFTVTVLYNFTGFFSPITNTAINLVNAGRSIPVKFSLSGNKGLGIMAAGYPLSQQVTCGSETVIDTDAVDTPGNSSLSYSPDQYHFNWKTEKAWEGQCRDLVVKLNDGTSHVVRFKFK